MAIRPIKMRTDWSRIFTMVTHRFVEQLQEPISTKMMRKLKQSTVNTWSPNPHSLLSLRRRKQLRKDNDLRLDLPRLLDHPLRNIKLRPMQVIQSEPIKQPSHSLHILPHMLPCRRVLGWLPIPDSNQVPPDWYLASQVVEILGGH